MSLRLPRCPTITTILVTKPKTSPATTEQQKAKLMKHKHSLKIRLHN